jgi:predicted nucleic acid-binding protein
MSAERPREFVDTNVLVYAYDRSAGKKHERARSLLADLWSAQNGCLSVQVLQEFYVTITRKVPRPLDPDMARQQVEYLGYWLMHAPTAADVVEAIRLHQAQHLSFWDAMVVTSASKLGCQILWSEDVSAGYALGGLTVQNPFAAGH